MKANVALLPGDGIGPEVLAEARRVLEMVARIYGHDFSLDEHPMGGVALDWGQPPLPDETLRACCAADAVLLGAVGGPRWDAVEPERRPERGLLRLREAMRVFANLRPVRVHPCLIDRSPVKPEYLDGVDLLVVRELTGGLYFGQPKRRYDQEGQRGAVDSLVYQEHEVARVVRLACRLAEQRRGKVTSIDKANVLESGQLWREIADEVATEFPGLEFDHQLVDSAAMRLISEPRAFDVIVTSNMFGDILTDEAAVLSGSLGLVPSASLGENRQGLYEPIHGSAPDIAGKGLANPVGCVLSVAMMLRHSFGLREEACAVERAVAKALAGGARTADLGGAFSTRAMGDGILFNLK